MILSADAEVPVYVCAPKASTLLLPSVSKARYLELMIGLSSSGFSGSGLPCGPVREIRWASALGMAPREHQASPIMLGGSRLGFEVAARPNVGRQEVASAAPGISRTMYTACSHIGSFVYYVDGRG